MMQHASRMHCLWRLAAANTDAAAALRPAPAGLQLLLSATGTTGSIQHSGIRTQAADAGTIAALHPHNAGQPLPPQLPLWRQLIKPFKPGSRTRAGTLTPSATAGAPCRPPPQHVVVQQQIRQQRRYAHSQPGAGATTLNVGSPATALPVGAPSERDAPPSKADAAGEQLPPEASEPGAGAPLHAYAADASPAAAPAAPSGTARPAPAGGEAPTSWWDDQGCFEYRAPLSTTVRRLKKLSLFGCTCGIMAAPIIVALDPGSAAASLASKASIGGVLASFGMFTTGLLHWFVSPYVHKLRYDPATGWVEATRLNLFVRPVTTHFEVGEAQFADTMRPQTTFKVRGSYFYLDSDHMGNKQLYDRLNIPDPDAPPVEAVAAENEKAKRQDRQ